MNPKQLQKLSELVLALKSKVKCPICLDYVENTAELQCSHRLCTVCLPEIKLRNRACPLCKTPIARRSPVYKDQFADELSKFTNRTCQLIKEKYAQDVEELVAKKTNLQKIIETAPRDVTVFATMPEAISLNKLTANPKRKKKTDRLAKHKLLNFDSDSTRLKIMNWLNDNQHTLDILTQTPQFDDDDDDQDNDFQMPSISQVNPKRKQKSAKQRSQSLTEDDNLPGPLMKRYQSLTDGLNEADDYNIDDVHSETLVKQVERKVLQDMLEDECLANLDHAAQMTQKPKRTPSKRKAKTAPAHSEASSGWERIENVKKTLNRASKEPKKLNISVQDKSGNEKKSPKRNSDAEANKGVKSKAIENKENHYEDLKATKDKPKSADKNTFNLSAVENYFEKHMSKIKVTPTKDSSFDNETDRTALNKDDEEDIFLLPTQETSHSSKQQNALCHISPVPTDFNDINSVAVSLSDNLKSCLSSAANLRGDISPQLVSSCFTNLLTYADKIVKMLSSQTTRPVCHVSIQTDKLLSDKYIQTSQNTCHVQVQSDAPVYVDRDTQTDAVVPAGEASLTISASKQESAKTRSSTKYPAKPNHKENSVDGPLASSKGLENKVNRKLTYGESQSRKFKRIRKPATDSDSDEGDGRTKKRFIRDDLTVEFVDSQTALTSTSNENKGNATPESERMDYDDYLREIMNKYDSPPPKKATNNSQKAKEQPRTEKEKSQKDNGDHVFTGIIEFEENLKRFDQEILEYERATKAFSTEFDLVENTPIASPKAKMPRLPKKKKGADCMAQPLQIISKGSTSCGGTSKKAATKDPSILNRNPEDLPLQSAKCADDVADILKDLEKDDDFFGSNFESGKADGHSGNPTGQKPDATQENIDKVLANLDDFDDIDEELNKISFTAAQRDANKDEGRVQILQNIKLRRKETDPDAVIDSTDVSDEEIVETTPQKKRLNSNDRSFFANINESENPEGGADLVVYLPPPPGFGDECATGSQVENRQASPKGTKSSLTPDRLTDFIVTPDDHPHHTQKQESQCSLTFKPMTSKVPRLIDKDSENVFSPIAKTSIKFTQYNFTPLVPSAKPPSKKPNLMTSTPNQKSILNYVVPTQDSPSQKTAKPCIMWSRILNKDLNVFARLECKKLLTTSKVFSPQVTHLVVLVDERGRIVSHTAKILQAIAAGIWVVRYEWAQDCLKMNRIVPEEPYEALDSSGAPGPRTARLFRATKPLFRGFKFYCAPPLKSVSKGDLQSILRLSGGEIATDLAAMLQSDGKVHIILTESSASEETDHYEAWLDTYKVVTVDVEWLTNCIGQYKLASFRPFLVSGDESTICDLGYPSTLIESVPYTLTEGL